MPALLRRRRRGGACWPAPAQNRGSGHDQEGRPRRLSPRGRRASAWTTEPTRLVYFAFGPEAASTSADRQGLLQAALNRLWYSGNLPPICPTSVTVDKPTPTATEDITATATGSLDPEMSPVTCVYEWSRVLGGASGRPRSAGAFNISGRPAAAVKGGPGRNWGDVTGRDPARIGDQSRRPVASESPGGGPLRRIEWLVLRTHADHLEPRPVGTGGRGDRAERPDLYE